MKEGGSGKRKKIHNDLVQVTNYTCIVITDPEMQATEGGGQNLSDSISV